MAAGLTNYACKNCPTHPQFLTKQALIDHWSQTHTVAMVEEVTSVQVLGQTIPLPQKVTVKHVEGPDI